MQETPEQQIDRLAQFIMEEVPGEPSQSQGAVDTAIRLLHELLPDDVGTPVIEEPGPWNEVQ